MRRAILERTHRAMHQLPEGISSRKGLADQLSKAQSGVEANPTELKLVPQRELHHPRTTLTAGRYIIDDSRRRLVVISIRQQKIRMIENIERLPPQLHGLPLSHRKI